MALPFFYISSYSVGQQEIVLDEDNSRHVIQVLRMKTGDPLQLTDGKGSLLTASILDSHKKKCTVKILSAETLPPKSPKVSIALSPLKNASRFEWFLEKATEIGVSEIIPLLCERTERQHTRQDRLQHILVSALLQSQQTWLPVLGEPTPFSQWLNTAHYTHRLIAHCLEEPRPTEDLAAWRRRQTTTGSPAAPDPSHASMPTASPASAVTSLILIGPEGDFSPTEVTLALNQGFVPVTLGENRLRSETAGVVAATLLCIG
jgi:16S rRNA (uracil1498-N3)-methyltransferase